jgi:hypothetical protein
MSANEVNYSLGVLIVLLMVFWFICKCVGQNNHQHSYRPMRRVQPMYMQPMKDSVPNIKPGGMLYGGTKVKIGNTNGSPSIQLHNGVMEVPNSKTATRDLMSNEIYKCNDDHKDNDLSTMYMMKKNKEKFKTPPRSLTSGRHLRSESYNDMKPMGSY